MPALYFGFLFVCFFKIYLFIYLFVREREREREKSESEHKQTEWQAEGEAGLPMSKEPDPGLNPRILGSWPELKADA